MSHIHSLSAMIGNDREWSPITFRSPYHCPKEIIFLLWNWIPTLCIVILWLLYQNDFFSLEYMYVKIGRYLFFYFLQLYCPLECECHCYYPLSGMASYLESIVLRHLQLPHLRLSTAPTLPENTNDKNNGISLKVLLCNMFFTLCSKLGRYVKNTHIKVKLFSKPTHILQPFPTKKQASD